MINKRLINLCSDSKKYIAMTILMNWVSIICNIIIVFLIGIGIDQIYNNENVPIYLYAVVISLLLIIRFICNLLNSKFSYLSSTNAKTILRQSVYKKLLSLGVDYANKASTSTIVQVAVDGIEALEVYFGKYLPQLFYSLLAPLTLFIFLSFISIKVSIILLICVPLIPLSIIAVMKFAKKILKNYWKVYTNLGDTFLENLYGLTTLKVFNVDEQRHRKMNEDAEKFRKVTMKVLSMQLNSINVMDLIAYGGSALGIITALFEFKNGNISVGGILIITLLSSEFFIPLRLLGSYFHVAMNGITASDKIFNLLDLKENEKCEKYKSVVQKIHNPSITMKNISFSYDGKRNVLENINLEIENKSYTALVGESGSGKSTIASLILKMYQADKGTIFLNGIDIVNIPFNVLIKRIALISTNSYIFGGTILENLLMAKQNSSDKDIEYALKTAKLYDFVMQLPNKLQTHIGEGGNLLSGGQKQRLALARAILADRDLIIFDEATSNVDVESEEQIWKAIHELSRKKTILVISHRLVNVKYADKIYVLNKGKLAEKGTHEELLASKSVYYNLWTVQRELEMVRGDVNEKNFWY